MSEMSMFNYENNNCENSELLKDLDEILEQIYPQILDHHNLLENLKKLQNGAKEIEQWAKDYDYEGHRANGYWSALRIGNNLIHLVKDKYKDIDKPQIDETLVRLTEYFLVAIDVLRKLRNDSLTNNYDLQASSVDYFTELFNILLTIDEHMIASMYGKYCGFWLCTGSRRIMITCVTAFSIMSDSLFNVYKCVFNSNYRGLKLAKLIRTADIGFLKKLGFLMELPIYTNFLPYILYGNKPEVQIELHVERQKHWYLSELNEKISTYRNIKEFHLKKLKSVRCKLFKANGDNPKNQLLFHCHGGGFVMGSPESHEVYLRDWANRLPGVPIISVDYTVSPKAKFPVALQEILDVYLWLISGKNRVKDTIGFHPKEIVLVGDSAGGNLVSALCLIINDIKEKLKSGDDDYYNKNNFYSSETHIKPNIIMPKGLVCIYSPFNLTLLLSPSMILSSCDGFISAGVMLSCFEAYINEPNSLNQVNSCLLDNNIDKNNNLADNLMKLMPFYEYNLQFYGMIKSVFKKVREFIDFGKTKQSWYLEHKSILEPKVRRLFKITSNPYISPLYYDNFESLSDVSLNLIALHFDPFLDDNISMIKKWKGIKSLDVLDGLQHGFLNIAPFVKEAKNGTDVCFQRIKETFDR